MFRVVTVEKRGAAGLERAKTLPETEVLWQFTFAPEPMGMPEPVVYSPEARRVQVQAWGDSGISITLASLDELEKASLNRVVGEALGVSVSRYVPFLVSSLCETWRETSEQLRGAVQTIATNLLYFSSETQRDFGQAYEVAFPWHAGHWVAEEACMALPTREVRFLFPTSYPCATPKLGVRVAEGMSVGARTSRSQFGLIGRLEQFYGFRNEAKVKNYLRAWPKLVPLLLEMREKAFSFFGDSAKLFLELVPDREGTGEEQLFALITTPLPVEDALARLDKFDEDWWLDAMEKTDGKLSIDVEIV